MGPTIKIFQKLIFSNTKIALQYLHSNSFYLVKKFQPWGISICANFRPMVYKLHAVVVLGLGKNFLFKSIIGRCDLREMNSFLFFKSRKKDARLSSNVYWSFNIWCAVMCPRNFSSLPVSSFTKVCYFVTNIVLTYCEKKLF